MFDDLPSFCWWEICFSRCCCCSSSTVSRKKARFGGFRSPRFVGVNYVVCFAVSKENPASSLICNFGEKIKTRTQISKKL